MGVDAERTTGDGGHPRVRRAGPGDWAALRRVRLAALADSPSAFGSTLEHELTLSEGEWRRRTETAATFLAWRGGEAVGLVTVFPQPEGRVTGRAESGAEPALEAGAGEQGAERAGAAETGKPEIGEPGTGKPQTGEPGTGEWHLVSMWVSPQVRGSGVAGLLVDAAAAQVRAAGAARLTLWVAEGNERARAFYRRMGFRSAGRRQTYQRRDGSAFDEEEFALGW